MSKKIVDLPKADFDAVFLPGTIHSCEDEVYIIYFNAEGNDGNGCMEIEVCDYQTILSLYDDVYGNTEKFFDYLPDYFQGKWYYTNSDTVYFQELCEMYEKADFIVGRDGGATEEMKFIVEWAKIREDKERIELLMKKNKAYQIIAKHIFLAHLKYESSREIIILADDIDEARQKAQNFLGLSSVTVRAVNSTDDAQIYEL